MNSLIAGDDVKSLQDNLGHYSAAFTLDQYGHVVDSMKKAVCTRSITIRLNRLIEQYLIVATGNKHDSSRTYELKKLVAAWHGHAK